MYELHVPLVVLSNRALQRGPQSGADPKEIKKDLKVKATYDKRQQQIIVSKIFCQITVLTILQQYIELSFLGWAFQFENEP